MPDVRRVAGVAALLGSVSLASPVSLPAAPISADLRKAAPDFALADSTGAMTRLGDFKGKVVLLNFWATWCHGCQQEIPWFVEFENGYKARGLGVVGASMDDDGWKSVKPYLRKKKPNSPIVIGSKSLADSYGLERPCRGRPSSTGRAGLRPPIAASWTGRPGRRRSRSCSGRQRRAEPFQS